MSLVNHKFEKLKTELSDLVDYCHESGDSTTAQLLDEVHEMLHISHESFLGNAFQTIKDSLEDTKE